MKIYFLEEVSEAFHTFVRDKFNQKYIINSKPKK